MTELETRLSGLDEDHRLALTWFRERQGKIIPWPEPLPGGLHLVNKAKGIHKPAGWAHALSVRQSIGSPYADREVLRRADGTWQFDYYQEGANPEQRDADFTNRALMKNLADGTPVAVLRQQKAKPNPRYEVLGVAIVQDWSEGYFRLEGFGPDGKVSRNLRDTSEAGPIDLDDARKKIDASIVARQGAGAFRAAALNNFQGRCAITDCDVTEALEAAHIVPYLGKQTNLETNTLLLRADIHTLFDRGLLDVDPETLTVRLHPTLSQSSYAHLQGGMVRVPAEKSESWRASLRQRVAVVRIEEAA